MASLWMDNIDEQVADAGQIVTYKWLARTLSVPADLAKQMLFAYSQKNNGVHVTYALIGTDANGNKKVVLVHQEDLEATKKRFSALTCEHVYSVQKAAPANAASSLLVVDASLQRMTLHESSAWSSIECKEAVGSGREDLNARAIENIERDRQNRIAAGQAGPAQVHNKDKKREAISAANFFGGGSSSKSTKASKPVSKNTKPKDKDTKKVAAAPKEKNKRFIVSDDEDDDDEEAMAAAMFAAEEEEQSTTNKTNDNKKRDSENTDKKDKVKKAKKEKLTKESDAEIVKKEMAKIRGGIIYSEDEEDEPVEEDDGETEPPKLNFSAVTKKIERRVKHVKHTYLNEKGYMVTETKEEIEEIEVDVEPSKPKPFVQPVIDKKPAKSSKGKDVKKMAQGSMMGFFKPKPKPVT